MGIVIAGYIEFPGQDVAELLRDAEPFIESALEEPGCLAYEWAIDVNHPGRVLVFEEWQDEASLAGHFAGRPYADMGGHLQAAGMGDVVVKKYRFDLSEPVYDDTGVARADFFTAPG
jgi:quinol monooxygenase YgiN